MFIRTVQSLAIGASMLAASLAAADVVTVNFFAAPGPDGRPGTADDVPYATNDYAFVNNSTGRVIDDEYASVGLHISGTAAAPVLYAIGGGLNPDGALGSPGNNAILLGAAGGTLTPIVLSFDRAQTSIDVDVFANVNVNGTSVPVTLKRNGATVGTMTLTSGNALNYIGAPSQLAGRWRLQAAGNALFDQATLGLSGPSNGGLMIDNVSFDIGLPIVINFVALPGADARPGTPDDVPYATGDFTTFGGSRNMDEEYTAVGLHISGTNGTPRLSLIGGGLDPDGAFGTPSNSAVLRGASTAGLTPIVLRFDKQQSSIRVDLWAALGVSGTSAPVVLKRAGTTVASYSLSSANASIFNGVPSQLSGRWIVQTSGGGGSGTFDEVTFGLTAPSNGGLFLDNLAFDGMCPSDFNRSGGPSVQDLFDFLAAYFTGDPRADFNNSGTITVQDLFDFLASFFSAC